MTWMKNEKSQVLKFKDKITPTKATLKPVPSKRRRLVPLFLPYNKYVNNRTDFDVLQIHQIKEKKWRTQWIQKLVIF